MQAVMKSGHKWSAGHLEHTHSTQVWMTMCLGCSLVTRSPEKHFKAKCKQSHWVKNTSGLNILQPLILLHFKVARFFPPVCFTVLSEFCQNATAAQALIRQSKPPTTADIWHSLWLYAWLIDANATRSSFSLRGKKSKHEQHDIFVFTQLTILAECPWRINTVLCQLEQHSELDLVADMKHKYVSPLCFQFTASLLGLFWHVWDYNSSR